MVNDRPREPLHPDRCIRRNSDQSFKRWGNRFLAAAALLLCASSLGLARPAAGQATHVDRTKINSVAEDSAGTIWATGSGQSPLYRWQDGKWEAIAGPTPRRVAKGVWKGPQGGVVAAWNSFADRGTVFTWLRGPTRRTLGRITARVTPTVNGGERFWFLRSPSVITTFSGEVLIAGGSPDIYQTEPHGMIRRVYTIQPGQYLPHRVFMNQQPSYLPLHGTEDGQGRIWFWSGWPLRAVGSAALRGFLIYDGKHFEYHAQIPGLPVGQFACIGRWDRTHLAAAVVGHGLYLINTSTLTARRFNPPEPGAFRFVQEVFQAGNEHYVVTSVPGGPVVENREHRLSGILWQYQEGHWRKLLTGLDELNSPDFQASRPWLESGRSLWLGALGTGLWDISSEHRPPRLIDWKQGFSLDTVSRLLPLPGGRFLAVDLVSARTVAVNPSSFPASRKPRTALASINPVTLLQPDRKHHLWGILTLRGHALDEWNGQKWNVHPLPGDIDPGWLSGLDVDWQGHIWLFPDWRMGPMAVYYPGDGKWDEYPSYQAALAERINRHVHFLHPNEDRMNPVYGPHSQIVYLGDGFGINYFDGSRWHLWNRPQGPGPKEFFYASPPFFDRAGHLAINVHHETYEWQPETHWRLVPYEAHGGKIVRSLGARSSGPPPAGCSSAESTSLVRDRLGRSWWTWQGNLYEGVQGECRMVLSASQPQPFVDGRKVGAVLIDGRGNVFLESWMVGGRLGEYVFLPAPGSFPRTSIHLARISPDSVKAEFASSATGRVLFSWRLDGGKWSVPGRQNFAILSALPGGAHTLQAISIDSHLRADPVPASTLIRINVRPQQQTAALLDLLRSATGDNQREAILRALAKQPASVALPELKTARAHAGSTERWWIDAAIQEIEQERKQSRPGALQH